MIQTVVLGHDAKFGYEYDAAKIVPQYVRDMESKDAVKYTINTPDWTDSQR